MRFLTIARAVVTATFLVNVVVTSADELPPEGTPDPSPQSTPTPEPETPTATPEPSLSETPGTTPTVEATPTPGILDELENLPQETPAPTISSISVQPEIIIDELIAAPGMGWQTCERAKNDPCVGPECSSTSAYYKFFWSDLQWGIDAFDFTLIVDAAAKAAARGQQLDIRPVMPYAPEQSAPRFLRNLGVRGEYALYDDGESKQRFWLVDLNDPVARDSYLALIRALGRQFDTDPRIGIVDISIFGLWGEGHIGEVSPSLEPVSADARNTFLQTYALNAETRQLLVDAYFEAFPSKLKVAQITDVETLRYAISRGAGVRLDCFGGYFMERNYPRLLEEAGALEVWRTAPVVAEICGSLTSWAAQWGAGGRQYNELKLDEIFTRAESFYHLSSLNTKNSDEGIPAVIEPRLTQFLKKIGYRFELREASNQPIVRDEENLVLRLSFTNSGIAPSYDHNHVIAVRLLSPDGEILYTHVGSNSVAGRLPGNFAIEEIIAVPEGIDGRVRVAVAVVDKNEPSRVALPLAVRGGQNGWHELTWFDREITLGAGEETPESTATDEPEVIPQPEPTQAPVATATPEPEVSVEPTPTETPEVSPTEQNP